MADPLFDDLAPSTGQAQPNKQPASSINDPLFADLAPAQSKGQMSPNQQATQEQTITQSAAAGARSETQPNITLHDKLTIFNKQFENYAVGTMKLGADMDKALFGNVPILGNFVNKEQEAISKYQAKENQNYNEAYQRTPSPYTAAAGNLLATAAFTAPTMAIPGVAALKGGGWLAKAGQTALSAGEAGIAAGALDYSEDWKERASKMGIGGITAAVLGGGFSVAGSALSEIAGNSGVSSYGAKMFTPKKAAVQDVANNLKVDAGGDASLAAAKLEAAQASPTGIGLRTPGQAAGGMTTLADEARLRPSAADKNQIAAVQQGAEQEAISGIKGQVQQMATPEDVAASKAAFPKLDNEFIDPATGKLSTAPTSTAVPGFISENKILSKYYDEIANIQDDVISKHPKNSVAQLQSVKNSIDEDLKMAKPNAQNISDKALRDVEKAELLSARNKLDNTLKQSDNYNTAMASEQKIAIQKKYSDILTRKGPRAGQQGELTVDDIYDNLFPTKYGANWKTGFLKDVEKTGGDPKQAEAILNYAESLRKSPLIPLLKKSTAEGVEIGGAKLGMIQNAIQKFSISGYKNALLDVALHADKWADDIKKVLTNPKQEGKLETFFKLLLKAAPAALGVELGEIKGQE